MKKLIGCKRCAAALLAALVIAISFSTAVFSGCGASTDSKSSKQTAAEEKTDTALEDSNKAFSYANVCYRNGRFKEAVENYEKVIKDDPNYEKAQANIKYSNCVLKVNEQPDCKGAVETIFSEMGFKFGDDYETDGMYNLYKDGLYEEFDEVVKAGKADDAKEYAQLITDTNLVTDENKKAVKAALK